MKEGYIRFFSIKASNISEKKGRSNHKGMHGYMKYSCTETKNHQSRYLSKEVTLCLITLALYQITS